MSLEKLTSTINDFTRDDIITLMKDLKLTGMIESYDEIISDMIKRKATAAYSLHGLLKAEIKTKTLKAIQNRMNVAKFPEKKDLNDFIFSDTPINPEQVMNLYSADFVKTSRNIIAIGGTGTGKSHLAISISAKAVRKGYKARFFNLVDLANQLEREKVDGVSGRLASQMEKMDILVLDELGYLPFSQNGGQLIFHLLSKIHATTSLIITSNLIFSEWNSVFNDKKMTAALLDRVCHNCDIIKTGNESYRMKKRK
jgi:DNA replication protein DnaC